VASVLQLPPPPLAFHSHKQQDNRNQGDLILLCYCVDLGREIFMKSIFFY